MNLKMERHDKQTSDNSAFSENIFLEIWSDIIKIEQLLTTPTKYQIKLSRQYKYMAFPKRM